MKIHKESINTPHLLSGKTSSGSSKTDQKEMEDLFWSLYHDVHVDVFTAVGHKLRDRVTAAAAASAMKAPTTVAEGAVSSRIELPKAELISLASENGWRFPNHAQV